MAKGIDNFPGNVNTPAKKLEFSYRAQELLRLLHNFFVDWRDTGKTQEEWDALPNKIKTKYPYVSQINKGMVSKFLQQDFYPRSNTICEEILKHRSSVLGQPDQDNEEANAAYSKAKKDMKNSKTYSIDVGDINKFLK